jgi:hypothetical protein
MAELKPKADMNICYFIGRLNPPHEGHIFTLTQMITKANNTGAIALILLGSGPKGERTMKDPITFKLKKDFLQYKLPNDLHFEIREMSAPVKDVTSWYQESLQKIKNQPKLTQFSRFSSNKNGGENITKLSFMETHLGKLPQCIAEVEPTSALSINATTEMSATIVRDFAFSSYSAEKNKIIESGFEAFEGKYGTFYGDYTKKIYNEIIHPLLNDGGAKNNGGSKKTKEKVKKTNSKNVGKGAASTGTTLKPATVSRNVTNKSHGKGKGGKESKKTTIRATPGAIGEGSKRGGGTKKNRPIRNTQKRLKKLSNRK